MSLAPVVELILFRPLACRFGQRFVSERDSWILRPYGGIGSTLVLYSGRLVSARQLGAQKATVHAAPFCRTFLSSVVFQGLVARHTNSSIFKAFLACARVCSPEEYALADFSGR